MFSAALSAVRRLSRAKNKCLKGLSHEIDLKNFDENLQNLAKVVYYEKTKG